LGRATMLQLYLEQLCKRLYCAYLCGINQRILELDWRQRGIDQFDDKISKMLWKPI